MWIFTKIGFFSAVEERSEAGEEPWIMVRARVKRDLERLNEVFGQLFVVEGRKTKYSAEILEWENRDYPYRVIVPREVWSGALVQLVQDIDYGNFKNEVSREDGYKRSGLYSRVWSVMNGAERELGIAPSNVGSYEQWDSYSDRAYDSLDFDFSAESLPQENGEKNG